MAHRKLAIFRRRLFTIFPLLSLWLCIATLVLWVHSYWSVDEIGYCRRAHERLCVCGASSIAGQIDFGIATQADTMHPLAGPKPGWIFDRRPIAEGITLKQFAKEMTVSASGNFLGFGFATDDRAPRTFYAVSVPHWFVALLFAILPALRLRAAFKWRKRDRQGHCPV